MKHEDVIEKRKKIIIKVLKKELINGIRNARLFERLEDIIVPILDGYVASGKIQDGYEIVKTSPWWNHAVFNIKTKYDDKGCKMELRW